jgi:hypothetical protein
MNNKSITSVLISIFILISVGCVQTTNNTTSSVQPSLIQVTEHKTPAEIVKEAKASINEVSVEQLKMMLDNNEDIIVLDVRERDEFEKQYISDAIHMSRGLVDLHLHEIVPDKSAKIVVY